MVQGTTQEENIMSKIITQAQAEAVYNAMCALNNVGGSMSALVSGIRVEETHSGRIQVWTGFGEEYELYATQADFARAYSL